MKPEQKKNFTDNVLETSIALILVTAGIGAVVKLWIWVLSS